MKNPLLDIAIPSPLEQVHHKKLYDNGLTLLVKRDDKIHPEISGNKYRKLKYNINRALEKNHDTLITFGGAFSNHLHATAAFCNHSNIKSVGIVRGDGLDRNNPTLSYCIDMGMELHFVSRSEYRNKEFSPIIHQLLQSYPGAYLVPEGGSNDLALKGICEIWDELKIQMDGAPDYLFCSAGTGATAAGLLAGTPRNCKILGFSALRSTHLENEIIKMAGINHKNKFLFFADYHMGGYAKTPMVLCNFINTFEEITGIALDPVYNGKAVFGFFDLIDKGFFPTGSKIVWLHTGGLQGITAMKYIKQKKICKSP